MAFMHIAIFWLEPMIALRMGDNIKLMFRSLQLMLKETTESLSLTRRGFKPQN